MKTPSVAGHMTLLPITVAPSVSVAEANRRMHQAGVRHLPVLERGRLVGVLSARDIALIQTLPGVVAEDVPVADAMSTDVAEVTPETSLARAVEIMSERKIGSIIATEKGRVLGILTTIDALRALAETLRTLERVA